jgi:selenoprotein W-related protein
MTTVEIEYCVPCGFLERAESVQHAVLSSLGDRVDRVALITGDHGIFEVRVDGSVVFEKGDDEFDVDAIVRAVRGEAF